MKINRVFSLGSARLKSRCQWGFSLIWGSGSFSSSYVVNRIHVLAFVGLWLPSFCCLWVEIHSQLLEAGHHSLLHEALTGPLSNMSVAHLRLLEESLLCFQYLTPGKAQSLLRVHLTGSGHLGLSPFWWTQSQLIRDLYYICYFFFTFVLYGNLIIEVISQHIHGFCLHSGRGDYIGKSASPGSLASSSEFCLPFLPFPPIPSFSILLCCICVHGRVPVPL